MAITNRLRRELLAVRRCFQRHESNNDQEKKLLWAALVVWGIIAVGVAFGLAQPIPAYEQITVVVVAMLFQQLGYERGVLSSENKEGGEIE